MRQREAVPFIEPVAVPERKDMTIVYANDSSWLVAVQLRRVDRKDYAYIFNNGNPGVLKLVGELFPGAGVTAGYGNEHAVLRIYVSNELIKRLLHMGELVKGEWRDAKEMPPLPSFGSLLDEFCKQNTRKFREIEDFILQYFDDNSDMIAVWRGLNANG